MEKFLSLVVVFCAGFFVCDFLKPYSVEAANVATQSESFDLQIVEPFENDRLARMGKTGYEPKLFIYKGVGGGYTRPYVIMQKRIR